MKLAVMCDLVECPAEFVSEFQYNDALYTKVNILGTNSAERRVSYQSNVRHPGPLGVMARSRRTMDMRQTVGHMP